ncbi:MAG: FAD:protein FMN transferase [Planctomycetaceae bacterium]|nr:FAD:protein FMN transferase [Planctomycetales bacterium]MCB9921943.1 FAD:protein FMN transferase [Planctomycetaceae bacterium]
MRQFSRRRFFCFMAGAGAATGVFAALRFGRDQSHAPDAGGSLHAVNRTSWALGSDVSLTVLHRDPKTGEAAIDAAFRELELIEDIMSIYRANSELSRLNRYGALDDPHPHFVEVLRSAQAMSRRSGGAFDVTVQPLWSLYSESQKLKRLPSEDEIATARQRIGWKQLHISSSRIRLDGQHSAVTLNGIAQGYAADRVTSVLQEHSVAHALVDTGEISTVGATTEGNAWRVGIQHPRDREAYVLVAELAGRCLATSGDYATTFSDDHTHHHLLDPRTGRSPSDLSSVSVAANSALEADALSTAVFVLGAQAGIDLIKQTPGADALLVLKDGRSFATTGFPIHHA